MSDENTPTLDEKIEARQARRKALRAALEEQRKAQLLEDLDAIENLEVELGPANIETLETVYTTGIPALVAVRNPKKAEIDRYQDSIKPETKGQKIVVGDIAKAQAQLGGACLVYPPRDSELHKQLLELRPAIKVQAGQAALAIAEARREAEGKE